MSDSVRRLPRRPAPTPAHDPALDHDEAFGLPNFVPVPVRERADGWTPARQVAFIEALGQTGCVDQAAKAVGLSARSAYKLRQHAHAATFRRAWDSAIDFAMQRLADAALSRAIHGVARPIVHKGEIVGERRYFDERLTQFMLRYHHPLRFGKWRDVYTFEQVEDGPATLLAVETLRLQREPFSADQPAKKTAGT